MMLDTDGDGVYTFTLTNVQPITDAEFKIVKNGTDWIGDPELAGPYNNFKFTVEVASDVTFAYNVAENVVTVSIAPVATEDTTAEVEDTTAEVEETTAEVEETTAEVEETTGEPAPEKVFSSVGLIGVIDGETDWSNEKYELEYADGVWSVVIEFTGGNNKFKARANDGWDISFGNGSDGDGSDYTETLTGTYKISVADGAPNGTALTVESVGVEETTAEVEETTVEETTVEETTVEETTVEETTVEETTVEETTVEETTVEETTVEETTVEETTNPDEPTPSTDTYVVVGVKAVFGVDWDPNAVANMMLDTDGDGVYTFTLKNVQPITDAEFKIVKNGTDWIGDPELAGPYNNFKFTVEVASDVTFAYNVAENVVTVSIAPVAVEDTTAPVEETTAPVEETTAPVEETTAPAPETFTLYVKTNQEWVTDAGANLYVFDANTDTNIQLVRDEAACPLVFTAEVPADLTSCTVYRATSEAEDPTTAWNYWVATGISSTDNCVTIINNKEFSVGPYVEEEGPSFTLSRVYFDNSASQWSEVYIHGWSGSGLSGTVAMTQIEGTDVWYFNFAEPIPAGTECFLFRATNDDDWTTKSENAVVTDGMNCWVQSADSTSGTWTTYAE